MSRSYCYRSIGWVLFAICMLLTGCSSDDNSGKSPTGPTYLATDFFVSAASGLDENTGKKDAPLKSIRRGIDSAKVTGGRVFVAEGVYDEGVLFFDDKVRLLGGCKEGTFARGIPGVVTVINCIAVGLVIHDADSVTIDGFTINCVAELLPPRIHAIAISLHNADAITISNNVITCGNGTAGESFFKPETPAKSPNGHPGVDANTDGCTIFACPPSPGGEGGELYGANCGDGGDGCPSKCDDGEYGQGPGGAGGVSKGLLGGVGENGSDGGLGFYVGVPGAGGAAFGTVYDGFYVPADGGNGTEGANGGGGGGGGGGGSILFKGGSGGGGGAGAHGGCGGHGGGGGGASIGIVISGDSHATITHNTITTRNGGVGGNGAPGGDPGEPGIGGAGGAGNGWGSAGGRGGNGGPGRIGGIGGGGGGGPSICIFEAAESSSTLSENTYIHGAGGFGGAGPGNSGALGEAADHKKL